MYASKKLLPQEGNYFVIERECLAIVFAVKKFQNYIYGREFTIQTDYISPCRTYRSVRLTVRGSHGGRCSDRTIGSVFKPLRDPKMWELIV